MLKGASPAPVLKVSLNQIKDLICEAPQEVAQETDSIALMLGTAAVIMMRIAAAGYHK